MTGLAEATLEVVTVDKAGRAVRQEDPVRVQFNPNALRYQLANAVEPNKASGKQPATQFVGTASATLAFDLVFDSTYPDDGPARAANGMDPNDVRRYITPLQAMLTTAKPSAGPTGAGGAPKKSAVPMIRFTWGAFSIIGVVTALNLDYDLFSEDGIPLRAKAAVTMKEIDPSLISNLRGPGANTGAGAKDPAGLSGPAGPNAAGGPAGARPRGVASRPGPDDRVATARDGESAAEMLSRLGRDPAAWKDLQLPGTDPLSLTAGARIDLPASLTGTAQLGAGVTGGLAVDASGGLSQAAGVSTGDPRGLTVAGGLASALNAQAQAEVRADASAARAAFGVIPPATVAAELSLDVDPRSLTFGRGVPLRAQIRVGPGGPAKGRP